MSYGGITTAFL